jgi:hypothetical protein
MVSVGDAGIARTPGTVDDWQGGVTMDLIVLAAFVAFFALVLAWLVAPSEMKRPVALVEPGTAVAD